MRRFQTTRFKIGIAAISTLLTVAAAEVMLRQFPGVIPIGLLEALPPGLRATTAQARQLPTVSDTVLLTRDDGGPPLRLYKPFTTITYDFSDAGIVNTVRMDNVGFCNPSTNSYDLPSIDVIAIGDSHTWCTTVSPDDTWSSQISKASGRSVYNLGRPAIGIYEYLQILKSFGLSKSPRIVIMNLTETNDLRDALRYERYRHGATQEDDVSEADRIFVQLTNSAFGRRSYVFNMALIAARQVHSAVVGTPEEVDFRYWLSADGQTVRFNPDNADVDEVRHARQLQARQIALDVLIPGLKTFVDLSRRYRYTPIVTYTPSPYTVYAQSVRFDDPSLSELMTWYSDTQRAFLATHARDIGYVFVDPTVEFQAAANGGAGELLYYASNLHMTRHGHRVLANTLNRTVSRIFNDDVTHSSHAPQHPQ
jgi:hypothetical protein